MKKENVTQEDYNKLLDSIMPVIMKNGLKGTTMDSIASKLQMSKRTLYEIFGSKEEMFRELHKYFHNRIAIALAKIFETSGNVMEAIIKCFLYNRDLMSNVSAQFIRDLEQFATQTQLISEDQRRHHYQNLFEVLQQGIKEGYFRKDLNLQVHCKMVSIQMESLKRTEELFPEDITLLDVYDSIIIGFLRSISSSKGLEELDKYLPSLSAINKNLERHE